MVNSLHEGNCDDVKSISSKGRNQWIVVCDLLNADWRGFVLIIILIMVYFAGVLVGLAQIVED